MLDDLRRKIHPGDELSFGKPNATFDDADFRKLSQSLINY